MKIFFTFCSMYFCLHLVSFTQPNIIESKGANSPVIFASSVSIAYGIDPKAVLELETLYQKKGLNTSERRRNIVNLIKRYQLKEVDGKKANFDSLVIEKGAVQIISKGIKSPVIVASGSAKVSYGIPTKVFWKLYELLERKKIILENWNSEFEQILQRYTELREQLSFRSDEMAREAIRLLEEGELEAAEKVLENRYLISKIKTERAYREHALATWEYVSRIGIIIPFDKQTFLFAASFVKKPNAPTFFSLHPFFIPEIQDYQLVSRRYAQHVMPIHTAWHCEDTLIADLLCAVSVGFAALAEYENAKEHLMEAKEIYQKCKTSHFNYLTKVNQNFDVVNRLKNQEEGITSFDFQNTHQFKQPPFTVPLDVFRRIQEGNKLANENKWPFAEDAYLSAIDLISTPDSNSTLNIIRSIIYNNLGVIQFNNKEYDNALYYFKNCEDLLMKSLNKRHPYLSPIFRNQVVVYQVIDSIQKAKDLIQVAIMIDNETFPNDSYDYKALHPYSIYNSFLLGVIAFGENDFKQAVECFNFILKNNSNGVNNTGMVSLASRYYGGFCYFNLGFYEKAIAYFHAVLNEPKILEDAGFPPWKVQLMLAKAYYHTNQFNNARLYFFISSLEQLNLGNPLKKSIQESFIQDPEP